MNPGGSGAGEDTHPLAEAAVSRVVAATCGARDWFALFDRSLRCVHVHPGDLGDIPEAIIGLGSDHKLRGAGESAARAALAVVLGGGISHESEHSFEDPRFGRRFLQLQCRPLVADEGVVGAMLRVTEATERHAYTRALRLQSAILEAMAEGVLLVDSRGTIRLSNPAADAIFGYATGTLVGKPVELLSPQLAASLQPVDPGECSSYACVRADGAEVIVSCVRRVLRFDRVEHVLAMLSDVTVQRRLEREILDTEQRERERIARDLHDGFGQELTGAALLLKSMLTRLDASQEKERVPIAQAVEIVNSLLGSVRGLARDMLAVRGPEGSLPQALQALAAQMQARSGVEVRFAGSESGADHIPAYSSNHLYRIAQEATSNALRHGGATRIDIELRVDTPQLILSITDNGAGFDPATARASGAGLQVMKFRAQALGGELRILERGGGGTRIECRVPVVATAH